ATALAFPRLLSRTARGNRRRRKSDRAKPVLIVGAGDAAKMVVKDLLASPNIEFDPIGYVDDDPTKQGHTLLGLPIIGPISDIKRIVDNHHISRLIIAMPSAPGLVVRQVVKAGLECGIPTLTIPSLSDLVTGKKTAMSLRSVEIQDLLRREPVTTDLAAVAALATGETVLITGAGGSIGSELCRQLARLAPARVILLGHGENSIFDIRGELHRDHPDVPLVSIIADVRDRARMMAVMDQYRPHAVFHAAAHKHVPLMEENVIEAVTNNVIGTRNVVDAAIASNVEHFVFISTDKAVRPTSVMGATKRVAEMVVQHAATKFDRNFVAVRFGNVLGSRGSVVPTFMRQIREGGPVTVTHPEMQRYFMTIPEAVQLVLQAGALGRGGEVFLLDMGEPVRVLDLATDLIRLSGYTVGGDIQIRFTGIRPGEKLYEEMFFGGEHVLPTNHPKILRARNGLLSEGMNKRITALVQAAENANADDVLRAMLRDLVPDFHDHGSPVHSSVDSASAPLHDVHAASQNHRGGRSIAESGRGGGSAMHSLMKPEP
ncbi:MAG TPA: nucleoside-diphosphate sugar epimerase/dehydratase, partial [Gemmatimonadaceae bacterium]|nr:nucleoside-diphosphate sugar epimerase/dehydratase [Gemmatimonadaceae bacterium]